ncbi:MAG: hypothetical protein K1W08_12010 [Lachnospiraceae bacterium]
MNMKKKKAGRRALAIVIVTTLLTGCQSNAGSSAETEALKEQIAQLEKQIAALEQQAANNNAANNNVTKDNAADEVPPAAETAPAQTDTSVGNSQQPDASDEGLTTYTMQELESMVGAFVQKADAAAPSGSAAQDLEQFFALKQEEKQIDDLLDHHEDELEELYKVQSLTREDYKRLERELERLEDKLDAAEDQLEYMFGIDD